MKACIMGSNLKQSLRGGGGRNVRISRFELRTIEPRPKFTGSYEKKACIRSRTILIAEVLGLSQNNKKRCGTDNDKMWG